MYLGPVVLKTVLDKNNYLNFLSLHVSARILCSKIISKDQIQHSQDLMVYFVKSFTELYGKEYISHNIHNLLHISKDVYNFGDLNSFSAFPFENYMQCLKKHIRKFERPIPQLMRRISEQEQLIENSISSRISHIPVKEHNAGPLVGNVHDPQFQEYVFTNFKLKTKHPDNCCRLKNGSIIVVQNFATNKNEIVIVGRAFKSCNDFFTKPCSSSCVGIYEVDDVGSLNFWPVSEVDSKYVKFIFENRFVVMPLIHCVS